MKATPLLTKYSKDEENAVFLPMKMDTPMDFKGFAFLSAEALKPQKTCMTYYKFYTVHKNETAVLQVSTNDFKPFKQTLLKIKTACCLHSGMAPAFLIPTNNFIFYGFTSQVKAMQFAKAGALQYISKLIDEGEKSLDLLIAYRESHYDDLNFNLTEKNISNLSID